MDDSRTTCHRAKRCTCRLADAVLVETRPSTLITQMPSICPLLRGMWPNAPGLLVCIFQTPNHHDRRMVSQTAMRGGFVNRPRNTWIACHFNFIYRVGLRRRGHIVLFRSPNGSTGSITTFLDCLVLPITHSYHFPARKVQNFFFFFFFCQMGTYLVVLCSRDRDFRHVTKAFIFSRVHISSSFPRHTLLNPTGKLPAVSQGSTTMNSFG